MKLFNKAIITQTNRLLEYIIEFIQVPSHLLTTPLNKPPNTYPAPRY